MSFLLPAHDLDLVALVLSQYSANPLRSRNWIDNAYVPYTYVPCPRTAYAHSHSTSLTPDTHSWGVNQLGDRVEKKDGKSMFNCHQSHP